MVLIIMIKNYEEDEETIWTRFFIIPSSRYYCLEFSRHLTTMEDYTSVHKIVWLLYKWVDIPTSACQRRSG